MTNHSDPRIKALAKQAARQIKSLTIAHNAQIKAIYQDFRQQAAAIREESSAEGLRNSSAANSEPNDRQQQS